jgi:hypothetical protein
VCLGCADVELWGKAELVDGFWIHIRPEAPHPKLPCEARTIRERAQQEGSEGQ